MSDIKQSFREGVQGAATVFPLALAMCACSPLGYSGSVVICALGCLLFPFFGAVPSYGGFILVYACAAQLGNTAAFFALAFGGALLMLFNKTDVLKKFAYTPAVGGLSLALAVFMTFMQTTLYFSIGASGDTMVNIIRSYVSLGFHANWRGVLYGTIALVLMITYPRKFKTLSKAVPAPFWCILFTLLLNLWLNPHAETTAIAEIGDISALPALVWQNASLTPLGLLGAACYGVALFFLLAYQLGTAQCSEGGRVALAAGSASVIGGICCGLPLVPTARKQPKASRAGITALVSLLLLGIAAAVCGPTLVPRIPIPTLAVILIVGMWQRVEWQRLKIAFTSGIKGILPFTAVLAAVVLINPAAGVLAAALCGLLFGKGKSVLPADLKN